MSKVLTQLREDHKNFRKLLRALEHQLTIFEAAERPDYDVLTAIAAYFVGFPERCHHPKEDLIYREMSEKDPTLAWKMVDFQAEHTKLSALARNFQQAVQNVLQEVDVPRSAFDDVARHFVREQRKHMRMEEKQSFPLALEVLTPEDWAGINDRLSGEEYPVFGTDVAEEFGGLRNAILDWEHEDEAQED